LVNVRRVATFLPANTAKLFRAGFESIDIEPKRVYKIAEARDFLRSAGLDVEKVKPLIDGELISAFVRVQRPNARGNAVDRLVVRRPAVTSRAEKFKRSETDMTKSDDVFSRKDDNWSTHEVA
jgi:hypothetical protein